MRIARPESQIVLLVALLAATMLAAPAPASADIGETIIQRCTHGQSLGGFSQRAYGRALKELSADAEEYTDCSSLIRKAQLAAAGSQGGSSGTGPQTIAGPTATIATPSEQQKLAHAASAGSDPVNLDGQVIHPGVVHASIASAFSSLPTPLLAILALLLACLLSLLGVAVRRRVRVGRSD
jgi:hypothetical protein